LPYAQTAGARPRRPATTCAAPPWLCCHAALLGHGAPCCPRVHGGLPWLRRRRLGASVVGSASMASTPMSHGPAPPRLLLCSNLVRATGVLCPATTCELAARSWGNPCSCVMRERTMTAPPGAANLAGGVVYSSCTIFTITLAGSQWTYM
jgi:hypothetical protein